LTLKLRCKSKPPKISALSNLRSSAATLRNFRVGEWFAGAYSSDTTGAFNHCAASATYKSGITTTFAVSKTFTLSMGFSNPNWRLSVGSKYDIAFTIDNMQPLFAKALAIAPSMVEVNLQDSSALFNRFRRGYVLRVAAADQVFNFNLTGTSQLLPTLLRCAAQNGDPRVLGNPFEKRRVVEKNKPSMDRSAARAEATTLVANLLSQAGIQGFVLLGPDDLPNIKADAKWRAGDLFGTITVAPDVLPSQITEVPSLLIASSAKACKGTFLSGSMQDEAKTSLTGIFTTCNDGKDTVTVYYLAVPQKAGGVYVITTATVGSETPAKEADSNIRAAAYTVLGHTETPNPSIHR
jgi:hypothetical protein